MPSGEPDAHDEPSTATDAAASDGPAEHAPGFDGYEVRLAAKAERDRSAIAHGRRMAGTPGAALAGMMLALRDIYEPSKDDQAVAVSESPDEPHDVDRDGVQLSADEVGGDADVSVDALAPRPVVEGRRRSRRR